MIFISVDLPAPFSPTSPWISPGRSAKSTSRRAATPPNDLEMPCMTNRAGTLSSTVTDSTGMGSDQEMIFHPQHAGRVLLGHHRPIGDDVLGDARTGLLARRHGCDAGDDGAAVDAA